MMIRSVGIFSVGKVFFCLYALIGLMAGAVFSLVAVAGAAVGGAGPMEMVFGLGAVIIMPIFYGLAGFIGGIVVALLYNLVASLVGGIEIQLTRPADDAA